MLITVISFWKVSIWKLRRTLENFKGPSFMHFSASGSEYFLYSGLIYIWVHATFITASCLKVLLKSVQKQTIYVEKRRAARALFWQFCRRCRRHMTSLTSWWSHMFYAFCSLYVNFNSTDVADHICWKSWKYPCTSPLEQKFSNLLIATRIDLCCFQVLLRFPILLNEKAQTLMGYPQ